MLVRLPLNLRLLEAPGTISFVVLFTVDCFGRAMLMAIIPLQAYATLGNARDLALLYMVIAWGAFAGRFLIPLLIERFRRRRVYAGGLMLLIASPMLLGLDSLPTLAAAMFVRAIGAASCNITLNLYIMDYVKKQDLVRIEPLKYAASGIAWTSGPLVGVLLFEQAGPWWAFGTAAGFTALALAYFFYLRVTEAPVVAAMTAASPRPFRVASYLLRFFRQKRLALAWLIGFGRDAWWGLPMVWGPILVKDAGGSEELAGLLITAANGTMFSALLFGWIGRRWGIRRVLIWAFLVAGALTLVVALPFAQTSVTAIFVLLLAGSIAVAAADSVGNVPFMRAVRKRERPEMTMVYSTYSDAASVVPSAAYSALLSWFPLASIFLVTGIATFGFARLSRHVPRSM